MKFLAGSIAGICLLGSAAVAAPVNGTGDLTPDVIFGSGVANGDFTGVTYKGIELGLRGRLRYDTSSNPTNTTNYDGDRTYTFTTAEGNAPANRSVFNVDWSVNVDASGHTGLDLDDLTYLFEMDVDPTAGTDFKSLGDVINVFYADHAFGDNSTGNGGGTVAGSILDYANLLDTSNVAQNSSNAGFAFLFPAYGLDPQTEGMFTFALSAYYMGDMVASTSIDVIYGDVPAPVPLPAGLTLLLGALGGLGAFARRRRG